MSTKQYCQISAAVFGVVGIMHLVRVVKGWSVMVGPFDIPIWVSGVAAVIALGLCLVGLRK